MSLKQRLLPIHINVRNGSLADIDRPPHLPISVDLCRVGAELAAYLTWLRGKGKQWSVIAAVAEFASKARSRRCEFLRATRFQFDASQARLPRGKQRNGDEVIDIIDLSSSMVATLDSIKRDGCEFIFPTRSGRPYTDSGFKGM